MSFRKKVTWNGHRLVVVIYERDIPLHISCSSLLLQRFLRKFDDDAEQYLRDVMNRKKLSRVSAPSKQHRRIYQVQQPNKSCIIRQKMVQKQKHCRPPCRVNPFKRKLSTTKIGTGNKDNAQLTTNVIIEKMVNKSNNKKQCTLDYFFRDTKC